MENLPPLGRTPVRQRSSCVVCCASCRTTPQMSICAVRSHRTGSGVPFASANQVKCTLFSVALVGLGVLALGGFENGDGVPQPPPKEWARRNDALSRAKVFRDEPFNAGSIDFAADPNRSVVEPTLTSCKYKPDDVSGTTPKFDCELPSGEKIKGEVRRVQGDSIRGRGDAPSACPRIRRRSLVARRRGALPWMPDPAISHAGAARNAEPRRLCRQAHRLLLVSRLQKGERRAQSRRRSDRGGQRARVGVLRARHNQPGARRSHTCRNRRAQADGDIPSPLGQQILESAVDVRRRQDGRLRSTRSR